MQRTKGESRQRSTLLSRFPQKGVSGAGVLLRWVCYPKKKRTPPILDACNIISLKLFLPFSILWYLHDVCRVPRGSRQNLTRKVVPTPSRFVWYLQDFCRAPRGSRQILTHKCCSYPLPFCVVFAGLLQGAKGIPANSDPQMLFLPSAVLCGICRTFAGRQEDPGKF